MGAFTSLLSGLALTGISKLTEPEYPGASKAPEFDFTEETAKELAARRETQDPQLRDLYEQTRTTALSLSRGEIPVEIERTLRRVAAENTTMRGLSAEQGTRLTAQALGKTQLELMQQGAQLTQLVESIDRAEWNTAADSALSRANLLYTNYANQEKAKLAAYMTEAQSHKALFTGLISGTSQAFADSKGLVSRTSGTNRKAQLKTLQDQGWWDNEDYYIPLDMSNLQAIA